MFDMGLGPAGARDDPSGKLKRFLDSRWMQTG